MAVASSSTPARRPAKATDAPERGLRTRGQRTQRRLLDAAIDVFATKGFHAARVDDIVKAASTSHGTFYLYFANKEELFATLAAEVADAFDVVAERLPALDPSPDGVAALRSWLDEFTTLYERYTNVLEAWTAAEIAGEESGRRGEAMIGSFVAVLAQRIAEGGDRELDPVVAATVVMAMIERYNYYVSRLSVLADRESMLDTLARTTLHALC